MNLRDLILPEEERIVGARLEKIVGDSFDRDGTKVLTRSAVKERFEIVVEGFKVMIGDLKWSRPRAFDHLPAYLHAKLNGAAWEPPKRSSWAAPNNGELG